MRSSSNSKNIDILAKKDFHKMLSFSTKTHSASQYKKEKKQLITKLKKHKNIVFYNTTNSIFLNRISPGCIDCEYKRGLTVAATYACNLDCFFCFYTKEIRTKKTQVSLQDNIVKILHNKKNLCSLAITGGEPLLELDHVLRLLDFCKKNINTHVQTRLYTNGLLLNKINLKKLHTAGLDEIRISIKDFELPIKKIKLAKNFIPRVMIEMPVLPGTYTQMQLILDKLNDLDVFGINLLEFSYHYWNASAFIKKKYAIDSTTKINWGKLGSATVKERNIFYYGLAIQQSENTCLKLLLHATHNNYKIGVHYCSLANKKNGKSIT